MEHMEKKKFDQAWGEIIKLSLVLEIRRKIYFFTKSRYPQLKEVPKTWPLIVKFLEGYSPLTNLIVVKCIHPPSRTNKCNIDGSEIDSFSLFIRNKEGGFLYNVIRVLKHVSVIESLIKAIKRGRNYCLHNNQVPLIIQMNSRLSQ